MANSKISALTSATTPLAGTETLPIVQSSATKKVSVANLTVGRDVTAQALNVDSSVGLLGNWNTTTANGGYLRWQTNGTSIWDLGSAKQVFNTGSANDGGLASRAGYYFGLGANGAEILRLTTDGNATVVQAAKGVNFTANTPAAGMTSQLLNWYEEGTWTVTLFDAGGGGNASATTVTGYYTRVGNLVTCSFTGLNSISTAGMTAGNTLYISLPFTASATGVGTGSFACENFAFGVGRTNAIPVALSSNSRAILRAYGSSTTSRSIIVSDVTSGSANIDYFSLSYRA